MLDLDLAAFIERDHQALDAIVKGDPEPKKGCIRGATTLRLPIRLGCQRAAGKG
jgi:hypothetical protein